MLAQYFTVIDIFRYRNVRYDVSIEPIIPVFDTYRVPILTPTAHTRQIFLIWPQDMEAVSMNFMTFISIYMWKCQVKAEMINIQTCYDCMRVLKVRLIICYCHAIFTILWALSLWVTFLHWMKDYHFKSYFIWYNIILVDNICLIFWDATKAVKSNLCPSIHYFRHKRASG